MLDNSAVDMEVGALNTRLGKYELGASDSIHITEGAEILDVIWEAGIDEHEPGEIFIITREDENQPLMDLHRFNRVMDYVGWQSVGVKGEYIGKVFDGERWWFIFEDKE